MKMKRLFYIAAAAMAVLSACTKENPIVEVGTEPESVSMPVFKATIEGPATKTTLGAGNKVNWLSSDNVHVKYVQVEYRHVADAPTGPYGSTPIYSWINVSGTTYTTFSVTPDQADATIATLDRTSFLSGSLYRDEIAEDVNYSFTAIYPASLVDEANPTSIVFPATQTYDGNNIGFAPMYYSGMQRTFAMKNAAAVLAVTVPSSDFSSVQSIVVSSDQWMNGVCSFGYDSESGEYILANGSSEPVTDANKSITLICDATGSNTVVDGSRTFYICIPVNHYEYLQIDVTDGTTTKSMRTNKAGGIQVQRNKIYPITFAENYSPAPAYEYVDLGLSVKWATMNVGATKPEEYGDYFAWGATETLYEAGYAQENPQAHWRDGKTAGYTYVNTPYQTANTTSPTSTRWTKYLGSTTSKYKDPSATDANALKTVLDPEDDAAHVNWGGSWRMPTIAELDELRNTDNCTWTWTTLNGVNGYKVQSKKAGYTDKWIFLPAAGQRDGSELKDVDSSGHYWSSSFSTDYPYYAYSLNCDNAKNNVYRNGISRYYGRSVRPVCE